MRRLTGLVSELMLRHGFEPIISLTVLTDRTLSCIITIAYDREAPGEDDRALACYHELLNCLAKHGYYSYRLSIAAMAAANVNGTYTIALGAIKNALDPKGILAPGRYVPERAASTHR